MQNPTLVVEAVKRLGKVPVSRHWVVECTFGWLMHCRRWVSYHEQTIASAAAWIYLAMIRLMLCKLAC